MSIREAAERRDRSAANRLPQFSARYYDLWTEEDAVLVFQGERSVRQAATSCYSGRRCWWSNQGDLIDSTLTREIDLSSVTAATLEFRTWFDIEEGWDYAYVAASTDGGASWTVLEGRHTTTNNPMGNSFGHGYTGDSGEWLHERIDLSDYAGGKALLRFEYVTDDAVHLDGFVVDDVSVPEVGFLDDAEGPAGWDAAGFVRFDNVLPQEYLVQLVLTATRRLRVGPADDAGRGADGQDACAGPGQRRRQRRGRRLPRHPRHPPTDVLHLVPSPGGLTRLRPPLGELDVVGVRRWDLVYFCLVWLYEKNHLRTRRGPWPRKTSPSKSSLPTPSTGPSTRGSWTWPS